MIDPAAHHMYFLALVCPPPMNEKIKTFKQKMKDQYGCHSALKSPAHITLVKPFWLEETWEDYLQKTLQSFTTDLPPIDIRFDNFSHFGKRVLFLDLTPNPSLGTLKEQVQAHFIHSFGDSIKKDPFPFYPHITIASRDLKPGDFDKAWEFFAKKEFRENFTADTVSLLKLKEGKWEVIGERGLEV